MSDDMRPDPDSGGAGDAALEARIVAWVLGEASAFEAAELERLLETRPALALFKRRIEAVHGLLGEAAHLRAHEKLHLAPERRTSLQAALGVSMPPATESTATVVEPARPARRRLSPEWKALRLYFGTAAACVLVFLVVAQFETKFSSRAVRLERGQIDEERMKQIRAEAAYEVRQEAEHEKRMRMVESDWADVPPPQSADLAFSTVTSAGAITVPVHRSTGTTRGVSLLAMQDLDTPAADADRDGIETVPPGDDDQRIVLDEFKVEAKSEASYQATATLAGTRLTTQLRDVGPAVTYGNASALADAGSASTQRGQSSYRSSAEESSGTKDSSSRDASVVWSAGFSDGMAAPTAGDVPIHLVTREYLQDTGATDNQTLLQYTANTEVGGTMGDFAGRAEVERPDSMLFGFGSPAGGESARVRGAAGSGANLTQPVVVPGSDVIVPSPEGAEERVDRRAQSASARPAPKPAAAPAPPPAKVKASVEADKKAERPPPPVNVPASIDEAHAAREPVSTFSLHVGDTSFKLAQAALARGQLPEPAQIRPEEFYNAFDYGDPSPTLDQKVACRIEQAAHPFLQQRTLVRVAMKVANTGRGAGQPLRLTLVLDTSGSMEREDRASSVRRAMEVLASLLGPDDRVTLLGFARQPRLLAEAVRGDEAARLVDLVRRTPADGGTNLEEALKLADQLAQRHFEARGQNRIVLLTDGAANLGDADPARLAERIEALRDRGIAFDACGVGTDGLDDEILEALTRRGDGRYYVIDSPEEADSGFARQLAGAFRPAAKNVKVQVRFNPARVGAYRLLGFEKHRLREEDFRNDRVDAAELAAEEAAVAVYQVEVLPQGEGDLGDVFVRFRDVASGQMVERSWTIAHDGRVRAFDQASPSLRLAGVAALLAEVLRGGALGDHVDLDALAPVVTRLKSRYAAQPRVQELATMFEQVRRRLGR